VYLSINLNDFFVNDLFHLRSSGKSALVSASFMFVIMNFCPSGLTKPPTKPTPYLSADSFIFATSCIACSRCLSMASGMRGLGASLSGDMVDMS
jgi:hypothetical protein